MSSSDTQKEEGSSKDPATSYTSSRIPPFLQQYVPGQFPSEERAGTPTSSHASMALSNSSLDKSGSEASLETILSINEPNVTENVVEQDPAPSPQKSPSSNTPTPTGPDVYPEVPGRSPWSSIAVPGPDSNTSFARDQLPDQMTYYDPFDMRSGSYPYYSGSTTSNMLYQEPWANKTPASSNPSNAYDAFFENGRPQVPRCPNTPSWSVMASSGSDAGGREAETFDVPGNGPPGSLHLRPPPATSTQSSQPQASSSKFSALSPSDTCDGFLVKETSQPVPPLPWDETYIHSQNAFMGSHSLFNMSPEEQERLALSKEQIRQAVEAKRKKKAADKAAQRKDESTSYWGCPPPPPAPPPKRRKQPHQAQTSAARPVNPFEDGEAISQQQQNFQAMHRNHQQALDAQFWPCSSTSGAVNMPVDLSSLRRHIQEAQPRERGDSPIMHPDLPQDSSPNSTLPPGYRAGQQSTLPGPARGEAGPSRGRPLASSRRSRRVMDPNLPNPLAHRPPPDNTPPSSPQPTYRGGGQQSTIAGPARGEGINTSTLTEPFSDFASRVNKEYFPTPAPPAPSSDSSTHPATLKEAAKSPRPSEGLQTLKSPTSGSTAAAAAAATKSRPASEDDEDEEEAWRVRPRRSGIKKDVVATAPLPPVKKETVGEKKKKPLTIPGPATTPTAHSIRKKNLDRTDTTQVPVDNVPATVVDHAVTKAFPTAATTTTTRTIIAKSSFQAGEYKNCPRDFRTFEMSPPAQSMGDVVEPTRCERIAKIETKHAGKEVETSLPPPPPFSRDRNVQQVIDTVEKKASSIPVPDLAATSGKEDQKVPPPVVASSSSSPSTTTTVSPPSPPLRLSTEKLRQRGEESWRRALHIASRRESKALNTASSPDDVTPFNRPQRWGEFGARYSPPIGSPKVEESLPELVCPECGASTSEMCEHQVEKLGWVDAGDECDGGGGAGRESGVETVFDDNLQSDGEWDLV